MADEFVKMSKGDETIDVHPLAVEDHKRLGWVVVIDEAAKAAESAPAAEKSKASAKGK